MQNSISGSCLLWSQYFIREWWAPCTVHATPCKYYPANTKHLYNVGPTSSTLGRRCINVIQMFCVCWVADTRHWSLWQIDVGAVTQNNTTPGQRLVLSGMLGDNFHTCRVISNTQKIIFFSNSILCREWKGATQKKWRFHVILTT